MSSKPTFANATSVLSQLKDMYWGWFYEWRGKEDVAHPELMRRIKLLSPVEKVILGIEVD